MEAGKHQDLGNPPDEGARGLRECGKGGSFLKLRGSDIIHCQKPLDPTLIETTGKKNSGSQTLKFFLTRLGLGKRGELAQTLRMKESLLPQ